MTIPKSEDLSTKAMNRVFCDTVATYKYYWLLSLLDMHVLGQMDEMPALKVAARMVAYAWYPIEYFKLSFGRLDSMSAIISEVAKLTGITVDDKLDDKTNLINEAIDLNRQVRNKVKILLYNVPFRFQYPWIATRNDKEMKYRSQSFENDCLYSLSGTGVNLMIKINPKWHDYLITNYQILRDFSLWNLSVFLQSKNPNVPNVASKLIRPEKRESLAHQTRFWNIVIQRGGPIQCIYTGKRLGIKEFQLDHFMPWSFVSHDQNWNLIPANGSINSSKSNRIPDLQQYLPKMASIQHKALSLYIPLSKQNDAILNDYFALGCSPQELVQMSNEKFLETYYKTFSPLSQMALNMGFQKY